MGRDYLDFICMQHNKQRSEYLITPVDACSSVIFLQNNYHSHELHILYLKFLLGQNYLGYYLMYFVYVKYENTHHNNCDTKPATQHS